MYKLNDASNYKWATTDAATVSVAYSITKAQATISSLAINGWIYGQNANAPVATTNFGTVVFTYSTEENGSYTIDVPTNAGKYYVKASVAGTDNYGGDEAVLSFEIEKQGIDAPVFTNNNTVYTGNVIVPVYSGSNRYTASGDALSGVVAKGDYTVTFTIVDNNYKWNENGSDTVDVTFSVAKAKANITGLAIGGWIYGQAANAPTATTNFGTITYTYYTADGVELDAAPTTAGSYYVVASVAGTDNYDGFTTEGVSFEIAKQTVAVPTLAQNSFVYTGSAIAPVVSDTELYTVDSNDGGVTVGGYSVVYKLVDSDNYKWATTDAATVSVAYSITKAQATISSLAINGWIYGQNANAPTATTNFGTISYTYYTKAGIELDAVPYSAGSYYVVASVASTDNYDGFTTETVSFEIAKQTVAVPTLAQNSFVYTGALITPDAADGELYTVYANGGATSVGNYSVVYKLNDASNYKWATTDAATVSVAYSITKAQATISGLAIGGWIYGQSANAPTATANFGTITYTYYTADGAELTTAPTGAGSYYVVASVAGTDNYDGFTTEGVSFEIAKQTVAVPTINNNNITYTGNKLFAEYDENVLYTASGDAVDEAVGAVNAGNYTVTFTLVDTDNYKWADSDEASLEVIFTVTKAQNNITSLNITGWVYGEAAKTPTITAINGKDRVVYTYYTADGVALTGAPTAAGTYYVVADIAESDNYFATKRQSANFTISKQTVTAPTIANKQFNNTTLTADVVDNNLYTVTENLGGINVGSYSVVLTLRDTANYVWNTTTEASVTLSFSITKGWNNIGGFAIGERIPYGNTPAPVATPTYGTVVFLYSTAIDGDYTTTAPTARGSYYVKATVAGTENYDEVTAGPIAFEIVQAKIERPTVSENLIYNGKDLITDLYNDALYTVEIMKDGETVDAVIGAGNYTVTITLVDTNNCVWSDGSTEAVVLNFTVGRASNSITLNTDNLADLVYNGSAIANPGYTATNVDGGVTFVYYLYDAKTDTYTEAQPVNAGSYKVVATVGESDNYLTASAEATFLIGKAAADISVPDNFGTYYENLSDIESILNDNISNVTEGTFSISVPEGPYKSTTSTDIIEIGVKVIFTPTGADATNYRVTEKTVIFKFYAVAYSGSTYYSSIEGALSEVMGGEIWVIPNTTGSVYIKGNNEDKTVCTIPGGVTLILPYADGVRNTSDLAELSNASTDYTVTNKVIIYDGVTLVLEKGAQLDVCGQRSANGANTSAGHTSGNTSELVLNPGSSIVSHGTINCYGYIEESYKNNGSTVVIMYGGSIVMPFVIYDFMGGSATSFIGVTGTNNGTGTKDTTPVFDRFAFINVIPTLEIRYGGELYGIANLYADDKNNTSRGNFVGITEDYILQLTDETYSKIVAKYDKESAVTQLDIYGGAKTNGLKLDVAGYVADTSKFAFSLGFNWNIALKVADGQGTADYSMGQLFKLLPGASLTVEENVTLTIYRMAVYEKGWEHNWTYTGFTGGTSNYLSYGTTNPNNGEELDGGKLIVYGTLIATELGGAVYAYDNATVQVTTHSCTTSNLISVKRGLLSSSGVIDALPLDLTFILNDRLHEWVDGEWRMVTNLTYDEAGGSSVTDASTSSGVYPTLPTPTRTGYEFIGWFYNGTQAISGQALLTTEHHTLTAQWKQMYYIVFDTNGGDPIDGVYVSQSNSVYPTLTTPNYIGYTFLGWYYGDTQVTSGDALPTTVGTVTLTARWEKSGVVVSFDSAGGSSVDNISITNGIYPTLTTPTRAGYRFDGWYYNGNLVTEGVALSTSDDHVLTAQWTAYKITYDANGGTCDITESFGVVTLPTPARANYKFLGWYTAASGGERVLGAGESYEPTADITLYAQWSGFTVTYNANSGSVSPSSETTNPDGGVTSVTLPTPTRNNYTFNGWYTAKSGGSKVGDAGATYTPTADVTLYAQWESNSSSCVTPDTLITLADGTQVRVDSLTGNEELLVWNMETGMFDKAPIMFVDSEPLTETVIIKLVFSDGTVVKVIDEHGFWDYDLNKYVYLDENAADYIGHTFAKQNGNVLEKVELVDVIIETEFTTAWSPVTAGHLCYFVNGMLSMPGGVGGLFNIFEVDAETMTYDYVAMAEDIEKYGLFTYEELNAIAPLSEDMFNAAGGAFLKVSIGKGNLTMEELVEMINRYSKYF